MQPITKASLRWGINSGISFIVFIGIVNPVMRLGALIILLSYLGFLGVTIFIDFTQALADNSDRHQAKLKAFSENSVDLLLVVVFILVGLFTAIF
jgi:preprotein translocase subunit SecY